MSDFVYARNKATKEVQRIPKHWMTHPILGEDYEAADAEAADTAAPTQVGAVPTTTGKKVK